MNDLKNLKDALEKITYKNPQQKFCPQCRGTNIYPKIRFGILPQQYECKDCGYQGYVILEKDDKPPPTE